ncbi:MAG: Wzz/FepE/Etk N-terminal domain-containing protein [Candidatus Korobacteraceae bacterium]
MREISKIPEIDSPSVEFGASAMDHEVGERRELDFLDLVLVLARRKKTILLATFGAAVLAAIVALLLPKMYTATTTILPPEERQSTLSSMLGQFGALGLAGSDLGIKNSSDLFVAMLKSRSVDDQLIDRFDLRKVYGVGTYQDARKRLESRSQITAGDEGLIRILVSDHSPQRAADLANAYVDALHSLNEHLAIGEAAQRRLFYQQKLDAEKDELSLAELALQQVQEKSGLIQPDAQGKAIIEAVASTRAQVAVQEVRLQAMRTYATPNNPDLQRAEQELAGLRAELAKLQRNTGEVGNGNLEVPTRKLPEVQLDYLRRLRDVKYHESVYEFLGKQLEAARIDEAKDAVMVQAVDKAVVPEKKSGPRRSLIVLATAAVVFVLSCLWVLIAEAWRRKAQDSRLTMLRRSLGFSSWNS